MAKNIKYIFVTGGVVSSLGKGIVAASLGTLLKKRGLKVAVQKFDPYINVDPGTMSPYQHGETFVTADGTETDLDLGHYERFMDIEANKYSNVTTGKIYSEVIAKERRGDYNGGTVQVIPHITDAIKDKMILGAKASKADIVITEIGGTVGDIESQPFIEAARQMKKDVGENNVYYIHASLIPMLKAAGEMKTKPTQHSVSELRSMGIQPDMLVVRTEQAISKDMREKLAQFTDVSENAVIESLDVDVLYQVPLNLHQQKMDDIILKKLGVSAPKPNLKEWKNMITRIQNPKSTINISLVGKYGDLPDAYISVNESLKFAGYAIDAAVNIKVIKSEKVTRDNVQRLLKDSDGIIVPGGFGARGTEGKIEAIKYARENNIPFLGICLGMQLASVEFARNVLGLKNSNSAEFSPKTKHPIIGLMDEQKHITNLGGTLRLGNYPAVLKAGTLTAKAYKNKKQVQQRHRHRYEFNNQYRKQFEENGMIFSGVSPDNKLVEIIEYPKNDFFIAAQYHPEFLSRPDRPEGLYAKFIEYAAKKAKKKN